MIELLLAAICLVSDQAGIRQWALSQELMDPAEVRWLFTTPKDLAGDLRLLSNRACELRGVPFAQDAGRFGNVVTLRQACEFNRHYRSYLETARALALHRSADYDTAIAETDRLYWIYGVAQDAADPEQFIPMRRRMLKQLRQLLGDSAYYRGDLPPCVPLWRFESR